MPNKVINYSSVEYQIKKLKSQQLYIEDEDNAKEILHLYGYSNLIKSYRDPYFVVDNNTKIYRSGVSFNQIYSLYLLDKNLRNAVMASMLAFEEHIKEAAANVIAQSFGTDNNYYLQFRLYQNKRKKKRQFSLSSLINVMKETLTSDKDPVHHYMTKYGTVPPWILFKHIYLGTIINFIDQFKFPEKSAMYDMLYDVNALPLSRPDGIRLMMDTLFTCNDYRNTAAHGGRIYNHFPNNTIQSNNIMPPNNHGFSLLLFLLSLLKYKDPYQYLKTSLDEQINRHCTKYPSDVTYLGQTLNINIRQTSVVFVSSKSNKYHISPYCSGMNNPQRIELIDAKNKGLIPCKRCCSDHI